MIVFDLEVSNDGKRILDIGAFSPPEMKFHDKSFRNFHRFVRRHNDNVFVGHNLINFDLKYLEKTSLARIIKKEYAIDTLYLSTLLYPRRPYHRIVKDDKLEYDGLNNPLEDSLKAYEILIDAFDKFTRLETELKNIFYLLLKDSPGLIPFFKLLKYEPTNLNIKQMIVNRFSKKICFNNDLDLFIKENSFELAFVLSYLSAEIAKEGEISILPPWLFYHFPKVEEILVKLRTKPCNDSHCEYCRESLDSVNALKRFFNYPSFRNFGEVPLQELAVNSALDNLSLIAIFPTGGGKSLTFQLPALMIGEAIGALTVVISPLQSLMKDQVDGLFKKGIFNAAFINGLQSPIERKDAIKSVKNGKASILYIAPESLRSRTIETLLLKRNIARIVIDEAHCFSVWGHDFRPDYLYIGDFINRLVEKKGRTSIIPVSCFTATAKQDVISDIKNYFSEKLNIHMATFKTELGRTNLKYKVLYIDEKQDKYEKLRDLVSANSKPTIIYASRIRTIEELYKRLHNDGFNVSKFHGKMESDEKVANQDAFMVGRTNIIVATNAFGMGVDKSDVSAVIHYDISNSLENYVQESGRAGRDETMKATCYILYTENDLNMHFNLLNFTKLSRKEIAQVWQGIKRITKETPRVTRTVNELAADSGWDDENERAETKIKTAILSLEDNNFIARETNSPRVYATSVKTNNFIKAQQIIKNSNIVPNEDKETVGRVIQSIIAKKRKSWSEDLPETRVDVLADNLGLTREKVVESINYLKDLEILANDEDMYAKITENTKEQTLTTTLNRYRHIVLYLIDSFSEENKYYNVKQLNGAYADDRYKINIRQLQQAIKFLYDTKLIKYNVEYKDEFRCNLVANAEEIKAKVYEKFNIAQFIISYLIKKHRRSNTLDDKTLIDFSTIELRNKYNAQDGLIKYSATVHDIEEALLTLSKLNVLKIEGGFLVIYSPYVIRRVTDVSVRYLNRHFVKLDNHYRVKNQHIHIMGYYSELMLKDEIKAREYVSDYFNLNYNDFIDKYFPGSQKKALDLKMSKANYKRLFGGLSDKQKAVIDDKKSEIISVAAGPGSGKTKLLVHKLASIIYEEDVRQNQLLMLTFSRNAALEFRERLEELIGAMAYGITITTFHSFCFDLLGREGNIDSAENIVKEAVELLKDPNAFDYHKVTKTMLVIDEAQDMSEDEYNLVLKLKELNDDMRIIAVGDDDQNIYEFRGSDSKHLKLLSQDKSYELLTNFRSKVNIVTYANEVVKHIPNRLKQNLIRSATKKLGDVDIHYYEKGNLIMPVVNKVLADNKKGRTCIMTRTNEEAALVSGVLTELNKKHKLVQDFGDIRLYNIYELRRFYHLVSNHTKHKITDQDFDKALSSFNKLFRGSARYEELLEIIYRFSDIYPNPYLSDLREFFLEYNDVSLEDQPWLIVANMHKVKGLEFENVYILYDYNYRLSSEELRLFYVGITRAKSYLNVHTTNELVGKIVAGTTLHFSGSVTEEPPNTIQIVSSLQDVALGYYEFIYRNLKNVLPGMKLTMEDDVLIYNERKVGKLSKRAVESIERRKDNGYAVVDIEVFSLVYWFNKDKQTEFKIMLPRIVMRKMI